MLKFRGVGALKCGSTGFRGSGPFGGPGTVEETSPKTEAAGHVLALRQLVQPSFPFKFYSKCWFATLGVWGGLRSCKVTLLGLSWRRRLPLQSVGMITHFLCVELVIV